MLRLWDARTGRRIVDLEKPPRLAEPVFSRDGRRVASGAAACVATVWDAQSGRKVFVRDQGFDENMHGVELSPDGKALIAYGRETEICHVDTGDRILPGAFTDARFSSDGNRILTAHPDEGTQIWTKRRPEAWWGVLWLPGFLATVLCAIALAWSVWRDRRALSQPESTPSAGTRSAT